MYQNFVNTQKTESLTPLGDKIYLSLVVPCFNEEAAIPLFYEEAVKICAQINERFEVIFIDDGSRDNTLNVLRRQACKSGQTYTLHFIFA